MDTKGSSCQRTADGVEGYPRRNNDDAWLMPDQEA